MQVRTKGKGVNTNTQSPVLVDSKNNPIDVSTWKKGLIGENYTADSGDHILPNIENPTVLITAADVAGSTTMRIATCQMWYFARPAGEEGTSVSSKDKNASFGSFSHIYYRDKPALVTGSNSSGV